MLLQTGLSSRPNNIVCFDVVRAEVPKMILDDVFEKRMISLWL